MATTPPTHRQQTPTQRPQPSGDHDQGVHAVLLVGAAVAVALVAALSARAAQLGGGAWLPVLAPFALVLAVPLAALAWLHRAGTDTDELTQAPTRAGLWPGSLLDRVRLGRRVPLARRNLFQDRRRVLLSTGGVAVALLLILVLGGIFAGAMRQLTGYIDQSGADLIVSQAGVTTMHMSASVLRPDIADRVRETAGVAWAEPIRYTTGMVSSPTGQSAGYVLGYDPAARHTGPSLVAGRAPARGEAVLDRQAADQLTVGVGDQVRILGRPLRLVGLSAGGTNIANTTVFITSGDFARLRGPTQAYVLVGARQGVDLGLLRAQLESIPPGNTVLTRKQFADSERRLVADMSADVMRIMSGIGFAIALAVIALTLYAVTIAKTREYGVCKALGARPGRLAATVAAQAAWSVVLALAAATALALLLAVLLGRVNPALTIWIAPGSVLRTGLGALLIGIAGALLPIRRVLRVDPADSFRRPT